MGAGTGGTSNANDHGGGTLTHSRLKVLWHWLVMGPYHFARMRALAQIPGIDLTVVESTCMDDHGWTRSVESKDLSIITLSSEPISRRVLRDTQPGLASILNERRPEVVVGPGYAENYSLRTILAYRNGNPRTIALLWSESTEMDRSRGLFKETLKSIFVSAFDGALVAGSPHALYLRQLGMPENNIKVLGNCVDNEFFSTRADEARQQALAGSSGVVPADFFLFVGRMLPQKNVSGLIEAYRLYRQSAGPKAWDLVLVGRGPEESLLRKQVTETRVGGVRFAGLCQADELPHYYACAKCLILPSLSEPWGLVVNEAMASGIPVLVSNRCGCAADLVRDGVNGFVFDALDKQSLASLLLRISSGAVPVAELGAMGRRLIAEYSTALFAQRAAAHFQSLYERKVCQAEPYSTRQSLTRLALRGVDVMTVLRERVS